MLVIFPDEKLLKAWIEAVKNTDSSFRKYLPHIDDEWYREMISCVQITAIVPDCRQSVACAGAKLFYKIIKNHHRIDGNKRSSLLVTSLFLILNDLFFTILPEDMYELAEKIAADLKKSSIVERELESLFEKNIKQLPPLSQGSV